MKSIQENDTATGYPRISPGGLFAKTNLGPTSHVLSHTILLER